MNQLLSHKNTTSQLKTPDNHTRENTEGTRRRRKLLGDLKTFETESTTSHSLEKLFWKRLRIIMNQLLSHRKHYFSIINTRQLIILGKIQTGREDDEEDVSYWVTLKTSETESTTSHSLEKSFWKRVWACHKTGYVLN
jgi:SRSO17 transposase